VNVSSFTSSPHVGTHADAPLHVRDGWPASDELSLDAFVGPVTVVDVSALGGEISIENLDNASPGTGYGRLLLKTGRTIAAGSFPEDWPSLSESCAKALANKGIKLLGVDAPSVDPRHSKTLPVHHALLAANACILENLDLRSVAAGDYELVALPLKMAGLDAAPVRAILRDIAR
jgi:arylformamidase